MKKFFYRVRENDSALSVARRFNLPVTALIKDNNLTREVEEGDILFIRERPYKTYAVQPSDTINSVAERFGVSAEEIANINGTDYVFYGLILAAKE